MCEVGPKDCPECGEYMPGFADVGAGGAWWSCKKCGYEEMHPDVPTGTRITHGKYFKG